MEISLFRIIVVKSDDTRPQTQCVQVVENREAQEFLKVSK